MMQTRTQASGSGLRLTLPATNISNSMSLSLRKTSEIRDKLSMTLSLRRLTSEPSTPGETSIIEPSLPTPSPSLLLVTEKSLSVSMNS
jgi:hypothetical protein